MKTQVSGTLSCGHFSGEKWSMLTRITVYVCDLVDGSVGWLVGGLVGWLVHGWVG